MNSTFFTKVTLVRDLFMKVITKHFIRVWMMALSVLTVAASHAQEQDEPLTPEYEKLVEDLGDPFTTIRDSAYATLIELDLSTRLEITAALMGSDARERDFPLNPEYEKLVEQLGDPSFAARQEAYENLLEIGLSARPEVTAALDSPDLEVRYRTRLFVESFTATNLGEYFLQKPEEIASLKPRQARQLVDRFPKDRSLKLSGLVLIDKDVAVELAKFKGTDLILGGLKSIDKDVAQELADFEGERLGLDGLESIDKDAARELASVKAALGLSGLKFIDKDVAQELAKSTASSLSFDGLKFIDVDVAQAIAKSTASSLSFDGLLIIDKYVAQELAKFEGARLSLNGLKFIDNRIARELLKFEGSLSAQGLASIFGDVAQALEIIAGSGSPDAEIRSRARRTYEELPLPEYLLKSNPSKIESLNARQAAEIVAKHSSLLFLPKLTVLDYFDPAKDKNVARELAKHKGALSLGGLEFIDLDVARELANMKGGLSLGGLKSIDKDVAQELANATAKSLQFDGLTSLDSKAPQELAKFKGGFLGLNGLESIDKDVARELAKFEGKILYLQGLKSIDKGAAQGLASFKGDLLDNPLADVWLRLEGLVTINQDVARELAKFEGTYLALNGLKFIDKIVASEMVSFRGHIDLQGLKSIDKDVAQELAKFEGKLLDLDGLESIDKDVARELASVKGRLSLTGLRFIDKDTLEILKSNPVIRLPSK